MAIPNSLGDNDSKNPKEDSGNASADLVSWVTSKVKRGRDVRDQRYGARWKEYTRMWRGFWADEDKNTDSERSKLIAPALQQAVEMTVAEMEEATFHRKAWFDVDDDINDDNKDDAVIYRDQLIEDFDIDAVPSAVGAVFLLGAVYGTGIAKINVKQSEEKTYEDGEYVSTPRVSVFVEPVRPDEFVPDPAATSVEEALFCAHEMIKPLHTIKEKQRAGIYRKAFIEPWSGNRADTDGTGRVSQVDSQDDGVWITEYYGKVPAKMLPGESGERLVEAIVTVANERVLLKAVKSPYTMRDRPIVAYQHDTIPGEFWGRGVCEKGYNPQKALDAELRARIDAMALMTAPMMGADITRLPRNIDARVRPGKTLFTRGRPSEIYEPLTIGNPQMLAHTFQHTGDLERMVQMGTGAMDSATPVGVNSRNETASGISQLQAGFIKRSKRTMNNVERSFLGPMIRKSLWRYMQFDPERYPVDMKFKVSASMGIMAKEVENAQLTNMLGFVPPESPAHAVIVQAIFENSTSANKKELSEAIKQMTAGPSEEEVQQQQQMQQLALQKETAELAKLQAEAERDKAEAQLALAKMERERILADLEDDKVEINAANAAVAAEKVRQTDRQTDIQARKVEVEAAKAESSSGSD